MKPFLAGCALIALLTVGCTETEPILIPSAENAPAQDDAGYAVTSTPEDSGGSYVPLAVEELPGEDSTLVLDPTAATVPLDSPQEARVLEGAVHPFMTAQLKVFIREKKRMPSSFTEFAGARMDSVPFPPDGMEYMIDHVNQQVIVVRRK